MLSNYESIFIIRPTLSDEETEKVIQKMQELVAKGGGEISNVENWGKKKLAYEIKKHKKGHYVLFHFKGSGDLVKELERNYRLNDSVIKFITVKLKGDIVQKKSEVKTDTASSKEVSEEFKLKKDAATEPANEASSAVSEAVESSAEPVEKTEE